MSSLTDWTNETPERRRIYEQECLIVETTEEIYKALEAAGLSKVALAERIGSSKSNITQLMSGSRNMTVRTLADIAAALGCKVTIRLDRAAQETHLGHNGVDGTMPNDHSDNIVMDGGQETSPVRMQEINAKFSGRERGDDYGELMPRMSEQDDGPDPDRVCTFQTPNR